jgi:hypothetical protein
MLVMAGQRDDKDAPEAPQKGAGRRARLEQALRANLLKRKAQNRARKAPSPPPKEGGQSRG